MQLIREVRRVGDDEVDAKHLIVGKHESGVYDHDIVAVLDCHHILADLAEPPQGHEPDRQRLRVALRVARAMSCTQTSVTFLAARLYPHGRCLIAPRRRERTENGRTGCACAAIYLYCTRRAADGGLFTNVS
jgi:hypothetical protein